MMDFLSNTGVGDILAVLEFEFTILMLPICARQHGEFELNCRYIQLVTA